MARDVGVEHAIAEDALQPQAGLQAALRIHGHQLCVDRRAQDVEAQAVADLQPELVDLAVFHGNQRRAPVVLGPPGATHQHHVIDIAGAVAEFLLVACLAGALAFVAVAQGLAIDPRQPAQHQRRGLQACRPGVACRVCDSSGSCSVCTS